MYGPMAILRWTEGDVVRKLRAAVGWRLKDLAAASGLPLQVIHKLERGKTKEPKRVTMQKLARAFGLSDRQLFDAIPPERDLPIVPVLVPKIVISRSGERQAPRLTSRQGRA